MRPTFIGLILVLIFQCFIPLRGHGFDTDFFEFALSGTGIKKDYPNQNAIKLLDTIPPELRDLPYATYPTDINYNTFRFNFNKRFNVFPKAIIAPRTFEEAQFVFNALKKNNLEFSIRSGGHCFESGSLSSDYIFDLRNFDAIIPNINDEEVYIGAGCLLNRVIETLGAIDYAIPTGTCPTVCVTGLTLGGGIGLLTRTYGLTCDSVKNITLLTANAQIIEVNENSHPGLFWALKGGGNGSYGIVLGFTFKMHYLPIVSFFELSWEWNPQKALQVIQAWQEWVQGLSKNISTSLRLEYKEEVAVIRVIGIKTGNKDFTEWKKSFGDLNPTVQIFKERYVDTTQYWARQPSIPFNKSKSKILLKPLCNKVIHQIVNYMDFLHNERFNVTVQIPPLLRGI